MAKQLKQTPISGADLIEFLNNQSDFSFEIQTLRSLNDRGFLCQHGGTFDDPTTKKPREFDIRATKSSASNSSALQLNAKIFAPIHRSWYRVCLDVTTSHLTR